MVVLFGPHPVPSCSRHRPLLGQLLGKLLNLPEVLDDKNWLGLHLLSEIVLSLKYSLQLGVPEFSFWFKLHHLLLNPNHLWSFPSLSLWSILIQTWLALKTSWSQPVLSLLDFKRSLLSNDCNDEPPAEVRRSPSRREAGIELWCGFSRRKAQILDR